MHKLEKLFNPLSVAVIGASNDSGKLGFKILNNIISGGFKGHIYPVNPKPGNILGQPSFAGVNDIPGEVDLAVIVIPAKLVLSALQDCALKKVPFVVIIASGFAEIGHKKEEKEIVNFCQKNNMRLLGPNVFGVFSSQSNLNATFGPADIGKGHVAIVTQSGAIGIAMIGKTKVENIGLSNIISVGNKADIDDTEIVDYLTHDPNTRVILMYIEGVKAGSEFVQVIAKAAQAKSVIIVKSGRSPKGAQAISSHTGSLAGQDQVFDEIARQSGAIRADSIGQALDWSKFLSQSPRPKSDKCVIITNGGGMGVMAADACAKYQVKLYDSFSVLNRCFSHSTPSFGSCKNPIDLTGQANEQDYSRALEAALKQDSIGSVICLGCETGVFDVNDFVKTVTNFWPKYKKQKPIVFSLFGGQLVEDNIKKLRSKGMPIFNDVGQAVSCLGALYQTSAKKQNSLITPVLTNQEEIKELIQAAVEKNRDFLLIQESNQLVQLLKIPVPWSKVISQPGEIKLLAQKFDFPWVMKIVSPDILHKSDAGGVMLNINSKIDAQKTYDQILKNCRLYMPQAKIQGIEVAQMISGKTEFIVGAKHDPAFGPIIMTGLGGIFVEVFKDVSFRSFPTSAEHIDEMISQLKSFSLLNGARKQSKKDVNALKETLIKLGSLIYFIPQIKEVEINPLIICNKDAGVIALDFRVLLAK